MMGTPRTGDKSAIQNKFYNDGYISTSYSEQKGQTNKEKYAFYYSAGIKIRKNIYRTTGLVNFMFYLT